MPQLNTATWFTMILSMLLTLFLVFHTKISSTEFITTPQPKTTKPTPPNTPWNAKWTKIYLPLS
uniref:ATP synthase complex subunit 8 n=1 Tax=Laonastes aenigmamus TaxID=340180 RepID=A0A342KAS8_9HYST|nr:ATP synthase F0 subunit 8 [Laonastes aenigmamus]